MKKVVVVGAGASGIMAAVRAAECGAEVTVLEQNSKPLKKLLLTGNGRCNLTNICWDETVIRGHAAGRAYSVLKKFDHNNTIDFFNNIGIQIKDRNGWVYPVNDSAAAVAKILLYETERLKIKIKTNQQAVSVDKCDNGRFVVKSTDWEYPAEAVVISVGSIASVDNNGCSLAFDTALKYGIGFYRFLPAITALKSNKKQIAKWSGVRAEGKITLTEGNKIITEKQGELQLKENGISGIPVFELSRYAVDALEDGRNVKLIIDFLPNISKTELSEIIRKEKNRCHEKSDKLILSGLLNEKLAGHILSISSSDKEIIDNIKEYILPITGYGKADKAQACMGGIDLNELTEELETVKLNGLYFTGEAVDVDGCCGGYNLQWAWSSGYVAGNSCAV